MRKQRGITLMELMVVMVVIAILTSIAYPSYRQYVIRSNRSVAKVALTQAAQTLERCFTRYGAYNNAPVADTVCNPSTANTSDNNYSISYSFPTATRYTITATPLAGQLKDTKCLALSLNEQGVQGKSGSGTVAECWNK